MKNLIGATSGGDDAWSTAVAGLECNQATSKAKSYIALMGRCQMAIVHFGGYRRWSECAANGFTCQYSNTLARKFGSHSCAKAENLGITGWQMGVNKKDGNCPDGIGNRGVEDGSAPVREFDAEEAAVLWNQTAIAEAIEERGGPVNEIEDSFFERRGIMC